MRPLRDREARPGGGWGEVRAGALGGREAVGEALGALDRLAAGAGAVGEVGRVDAGTLFEQAARETVRELLADDEVDRGDSYQRRMFTGGSDSSRTNPDIVVHRSGAVRAAGDVKYKTLAIALGEARDDEEPAERTKKEGRPDLYQVLVHAASLNTDRAFLVYAGDAYTSRHLGLSATGCETWTAQVRPTHLVDDLGRFLRESGLLQARVS